MTHIAVAGMACRYPDARTPRELWENVLARRQAFRRIPPERLPLADYYSPDPDAPDRTYSAHAAVLHDWTFDRAAFRVSEATYDATDPAHWLALQVAAEAIGDCGVELPVERTAVIVGNTLTGDASRAASLRLRWPYVRRAAEAAGADAELVRALEAKFKEPFAEIGEETLAGGLSNTIAGRICNYYGFHGGGYAIDGACSSSLLAVAQACTALAAGDADAVLAGGVDLSLDPFELIGFAKCTALARERMFVYDRRASGFLPGEGCGFVVLLREEDARGLRVYATITGWGVSSDGHGGLTRPESRGQRLALTRAYERARCTANDVGYFEGHGTGTPVGDPVEIETIRSLLDDTNRPHYLGSIKANIGHTKAAAGIAGLLKAALAVHHGVIPPATACEQPHAGLSGALRVTAEALPWNEPARRAGVSAMGFGGINAHVVLESDAPAAPFDAIAACDAPLFLFDGHSEEEVRRSLDAVLSRRAELSLAEQTDLAHALQRRLCGGEWRAAMVAWSSPRIARVQSAPRVAFLFSGQASLPFAEQRAIVEASLAALRKLRALGIEAEVAIGHSLGELTALHWAGAFDEDELLALVSARGEAMSAIAGDGAMAAFSCDASDAAQFGLSIAALNAPRQTVLSGPRADVGRAVHAARARGIAATLLPVAAAFHSPMMAATADALRDALRRVDIKPPQRRVISTIGGGDDIRERLIRQLTSPVLFHDALRQLDVDLIIEVGPGSVLAQLAGGLASEDLLACAAAFWERGGALRSAALFEGRFTRPFDLERRPVFITSPCERIRRAPVETPPVPIGDRDAESVLRSLVATQTALSLDLVAPSSRLLSDLHLSSITVGRILGQAARMLGAPPLLDPTSLANATIAEAAAALDRARSEPQPEPPADGIAPWVRAFEVLDTPAPLHTRRITQESSWRFLGRDWPELRARFETVRGRGVVLIVPEEPIAALLDLARQLADGDRAVIVQNAARVSGFARTLFLERPRISVRIVASEAVDEIAADAEASGDFCEAVWREGVRYEPRVRAIAPRATRTLLTSADTILVTGGTQGIGRELARQLAKTTGARLLLTGRSTGHDVTQPLPPLPHVTAVIHAAGNNEPALIDALDEDAFRNTLDVKCTGLHNVLAAIDSSKLRLLVTFGSVIARTGLRGEAHYALANEWLARDTEEFAKANPQCRTLCLEWSVWAGAGMGVRLGAIDSLRRQGVVPIAEDDALRIASQLIDGDSATRVMIAGRLGDPPTIRYADDEPPLLRFIDNVRVHVPGVELVADTTLSVSNDPYLADHIIKGEPLLPAVIGLEAMAQAAFAITGQRPSRIENIDLRRPIGGSTLRVAALASGDRVDTVLRTSDTQLLFDHFRAAFRTSTVAPATIDLPDSAVDIDPASVYEHLLFHTGRFRRIRAYRVLRAFECVAELTPSGAPWFHRFAPPGTLLGDGAMRDAAIHALQACIPQSIVLPVAIDSIDLHEPLTGSVCVSARETARDGEDLLWNLDLATPAGRIIERWRGLRLRPVERRANVDELPPALWGPLLERECGVRVVVGKASSDEAMRDAARSSAIARRDDGKPIAAHGHVSASHDGALTMAVAGENPVGCDLQIVDGLPWQTILHPRDLALAALCTDSTGDEERFAAARVWAARESCAKACGDALLPLTLDTAGAPRRVTFSAGDTRIDTFAIGDRIAAIAYRIERSHR